MSAWYERNREKAINDAKQWRLNNLDRYRASQNAWRKAQRASKRTEKLNLSLKQVVLFVPAPGYDRKTCGDYGNWCSRYGIDPKKSWHEPTDEYFG